MSLAFQKSWPRRSKRASARWKVPPPILRHVGAGDLTLVGQERADFLYFLVFLAVRVPTFRNQIERAYEEVGRKVALVSASHREHFADIMKKALALESRSRRMRRLRLGGDGTPERIAMRLGHVETQLGLAIASPNVT